LNVVMCGGGGVGVVCDLFWRCFIISTLPYVAS
jgi:hypothetical protein